VSASLRALCLAEAGPGIGLGHLRRCQALARTLSARGATVRLLVAGDVGGGGDVSRLEWTRDPALAGEALATWRPEVVVVDSYHAGTELLERAAALTACTVAVDDLADRPLPVHLVVNGAWHAARLAYRGRPGTAFLLGPEYALLDSVFAEAPRRARPGAVRRVLVTLGGDPPADALGAALAAVRRAAPAARIDVALGPFAPARHGAETGVVAHRGLDSLRELMLEADLAVTGGGMTLYECLATSVPVVGVCLADNQRPNIDELGRAGLILKGEPSLEGAIERLAGDPALRRSMSARGRRTVDGRGTERVADAIERACLAVGAARSAR
jgi:UDP-2,4-diacetamido-2,4,6-trideoxy-beta-L-altropyranose hydrolase